MSDYKKTLQLPQTNFPMKANLKQREPEILAFWEKIDAYSQMINANKGKDSYILHDGPPYANGHIHMGTALNKTLKDFIIKSRNMQGFFAPYVPGWDCHGLPIEHSVAEDLKKKNKELPQLIIRKLCREFALKWVDTQRKEFKRLGVLATWDEPYMTLNPKYEAATARELTHFMKNDGVVRGKKPIYWCCDCETALAEAEVEYQDHSSSSIYVAFPLADDKIAQLANVDKNALSIVIWTTTPWTIPDNMAVAVHPDFEYDFVQVAGHTYILADSLLEECAKKFEWEDYKVLKTVLGKELENGQAKHPLYDRPSPIVLAPYVTLETGTGCVHTAPGHGREDFETGLRYGLEIYSPINDKGEFFKEVEFFAGMTIFDANPKVIEKLKEVNALLKEEKITHSYPHCWRCRKPLIFRATTQWFVAMDKNNLREKALKAVRSDVDWLPAWGEDRIYSMIENRPDWCISRQRTWGVPITALICQECDAVWYEDAWLDALVQKFEEHPTGCDYWFEKSVEELAPKGLTCPHCQSTKWKKETDILDVWFDSGTSFAAVLEQRSELSFPADLYLEGSDQHRGWFHSSLLASIGTRGKAPYKQVLTHGYVVDKKGHKMSKSVGNVIAPQEIIDNFGAEILRMWVCAVNYQEDIKISDEILNRLVDAYRRIRNTLRFLLGNIADFNPAEHAVADEDLLPLDKFALHLITQRYQSIEKAYHDFEFHKVYHTLHNLCIVDLSSFYLDIVKDRLYVEAPNSRERRSAQTVLWNITLLFLQAIAPVLSFTAEEAYGHLAAPQKSNANEDATVFSLRYKPSLTTDKNQEEFAPTYKKWEQVLILRSEVTKAIEPLRRDGVIGHSLNTTIELYVSESMAEFLLQKDFDLAEFFIVSQVSISTNPAPANAQIATEIENVAIVINVATGTKCERCWRISTSVGEDATFSDVCPRCASVLNKIGFIHE